MSVSAGEAKWNKNWPRWLDRFRQRHGNRYSYPSSERVIDKGAKPKIRIVCGVHGEFVQDPDKHASGQGCPHCSDKGGEDKWLRGWPAWVAKATTRHSGKYRYLSSQRERDGNGRWTIRIACPDHGEFMMAPNKHVFGQGCPKCAGRGTDKLRILQDRFPAWDFKNLEVGGSKENLTLVCPEHGEFSTTFNRLQNTRGTTPCPRCNKAAAGVGRRKPLHAWSAQVGQVYGGKLTLDQLSVTTADQKARFVCTLHGEFSSVLQDVVSGHGCPSCAVRASKGEDEIREWLSGMGLNVVSNDRGTLGGREIDILLPDERVGIEYCGLYWHSEAHTDKEYHRSKMIEAKAAGIRLITVFEDEWLFRSGHVKAQLLGVLGANRRVHARELTVRAMQWREAEAFLDMWHMAGSGVPAPINYGLFDGNTLVSVMSVGRARFDKAPGGYEMYRYCVGEYVRVAGGTSRLLKKITSDHPEIVKLTTYADLRWGTGQGYKAAGFEYVGDTKPGYFWCKGVTRFSRNAFQKHKLGKVLALFDPELTEVENCHANGLRRIWDCGSSKWEWARG